MKHPALSPHMLVADLLADQPAAASLLVELRTDCVGCFLNRFCTLEDACRQYKLDVNVVLQRLNEQREKQASY